MPRPVIQEVRFPGTGRRLRAARIAHGFGARGGLKKYAVDAGLEDNRYGQWENGISRIEIGAAIALCKTWKLTLDYIYLGDRSGLSEKLKHSIAATDTTE